MDSRASVVSHMAVAGDRILAVGTADDVAPFVGKDTVSVDLKGKTMLPGFYDGHSHFMRAGMMELFYLNLSSPPVGTVACIQDIAERVKAYAATIPKGQWILCAVYDETSLKEARHCTLAELDAMAPEHPLFILHMSGHTAVVNSLGLAAAGITADTPDPQGGCYRKDQDGKLNGLVEEPPAMDPIRAQIPALTQEDWVRSVERASAMYVAKGVTTAHDGGVTTAMWESYFAAHKQGVLRNRVQMLPRFGGFDDTLVLNTACGTQLTPDALLSLGAIKMFQDGSIQQYTGYLSNPYHKVLMEGVPNPDLWRGYPIYKPHVLNEQVLRYHKAGWQVAIHGNGDDAIEEILNAFEAAQKHFPRADARHIIIHCQTIREDQLDRMKRLGVVPSFFVTHTYFWGERHINIFLGPERAKRINPLRSAMERGIRFTTHNDTFVTPINPLLSVWSAVNRLSSTGNTIGEAQRISVLDALRSVTIWGAYQFCEDHFKGSLEPGKLADMVVLDENPCTVAPEHIKDIAIAATIVGNKVVYGSL